MGSRRRRVALWVGVVWAVVGVALVVGLVRTATIPNPTQYEAGYQRGLAGGSIEGGWPEEFSRGYQDGVAEFNRDVDRILASKSTANKIQAAR